MMISLILEQVFSQTNQNEWIEIELYNIEKEQYWSTPLRNTSLQTSPYGIRDGRMHQGIDLGLRKGEQIFAVFDGVVQVSSFDYGYGNYIIIKHHNGLETLYAHLEARIKVGAKIKAGQMIALGGNTGWSTGAHLHFEVRYQGKAFNPNYIFDFYRPNQIKVNRLYLSTKVFAQETSTHLDKW